MSRTVVLGIAGVAVVTAAATGVAFAADGSSSASGAATLTSAPATTAAATTQPRPRTGRALHGTFTVERKGAPTVVDVQRGMVTAADPSSITVRSSDGFSATYGLTSATKIRKDKKAATAADVPVGTRVGVLADAAGGHPTARTVRVLPKQ
jgi:hypothetical protein